MEVRRNSLRLLANQTGSIGVAFPNLSRRGWTTLTGRER